MRVFLKRYGILGANTLLLALVCSLHHWVGLIENGRNYTPFAVSSSVSALTFDETHAYVPPARRFMSSGTVNAEADNFEGRNKSAGIPVIPAAVMGGMGRLLGNLKRAFIAADCIFPACLFLLLYALTGALIGDRTLRLLVAWGSILIPFGLRDSFWIGEDSLIAPLEITRTPQPELSFLVLMLTAFLLGRALNRNSHWLWAVAAGAASGAVVYCYYFYAVAWGITLGLLALFGVLWKSRTVWTRGTAAALLMMIVSVPYLLMVLRGKAEGGQTQLLERMGAYTHRPDVLPLLGALLLTILLFAIGRNLANARPVYFVLALLVAGSLYGMNFQIISGYETQRWHFWKRLAQPVCFFLTASAAAHLVESRFGTRRNRVHRTTCVLLILLIADAAARQIYAASRVAEFHRDTQPDIEMLEWVRHNVPKDQVIGAIDPQVILLIPVLTTDYTYVPSGLRSLTSGGEIKRRYFELACLMRLSAADVKQEASVPDHLGRSTELLRVLGLSYTGDRAVYNSFVSDYQEFSKTCPAPERRLDYLALPAHRITPPNLKRAFPKLHEIYRNAAYVLIDLRNGGS